MLKMYHKIVFYDLCNKSLFSNGLLISQSVKVLLNQNMTLPNNVCHIFPVVSPPFLKSSSFKSSGVVIEGDQFQKFKFQNVG